MYFKLYFWEKQKQRKNVIGGIFYPAFSVNTVFYITRIYVFCLAFILNENILFWLTISYQKPFVFSVSVFCSQIFTLKLNLRPNIGLTYAISIVKRFFGKYFFTFLCWIWITYVSQQYCENLRKNEQVEVVENMPPSYLLYRFLQNLHSFLLYGKKWKYLIF